MAFGVCPKKNYDKFLTVFFALFFSAVVSMLYFFGVNHAWFPALTSCDDPMAVRIAKELSDVDKWYASDHHVTRKDGRVQIWWSNNVYGLGIEEGQFAYAMPDEGHLSLSCRSLIYRALEPRIPERNWS